MVEVVVVLVEVVVGGTVDVVVTSEVVVDCAGAVVQAPRRRKSTRGAAPLVLRGTNRRNLSLFTFLGPTNPTHEHLSRADGLRRRRVNGRSVTERRVRALREADTSGGAGPEALPHLARPRYGIGVVTTSLTVSVTGSPPVTWTENSRENLLPVDLWVIVVLNGPGEMSSPPLSLSQLSPVPE